MESTRTQMFYAIYARLKISEQIMRDKNEGKEA